jgi:transcriptional regulator with XRE-family HTH domain
MGAEDHGALGGWVRAERQRQGLTQMELARRIHVCLGGKNKCPHATVIAGYVKRWETGKYGMSTRYRLACAQAFSGPPASPAAAAEGQSASPGSVTALPAAGSVNPRVTFGDEDSMERRRLLQAALGMGAGAFASPLLGGLTPDSQQRLAWAQQNPARIDTAAVESLAGVLAAQRRAEDALGSAVMLRPALAQLLVIEDLVHHAHPPIRAALLNIAQQWAQYAGWLCRNTLNTSGAEACLSRALEWATEIGDHTMISTVLTEKSELAMFAGRPGAAIGTAQAAQQDSQAATEQLILAACFEACAQAMAGDAAAADRKLGEAGDLAGGLPGRSQERRPWLYWMTPAWFLNESGIACSYLAADPRWHARAVTALETAGSDSLWASAVNLTYLATAHAKAGEIESACVTGLQAAAAVQASGSRRCAARLARVHAELAAAHPGDPRVAELADALR